MHRKERDLSILPFSYSDLPLSESNLKSDLRTTLPFHMLYVGSPVNANKRSCFIFLSSSILANVNDLDFALGKAGGR